MVRIKFSDADPYRDRVFLIRVIRATGFELNVCELPFFHPGDFSLCFGNIKQKACKIKELTIFPAFSAKCIKNSQKTYLCVCHDFMAERY